MQDLSTEAAVVEPLLSLRDCELWVKREDRIHPQISGNKWRKLKYHLQAFRQSDKSDILSFGGAFSNHLAALAALGQMAKIPTHALVRGELHDNPTLRFCRRCGMKLEAISREKYRQKDHPDFLQALADLQPQVYIIPEGGKGPLGLAGCREILDEVPPGFTHLALAAGTGTTAAGLLLHPYPAQREVYPALKGGAVFLRRAIAEMALAFAEKRGQEVPKLSDWQDKLQMIEGYHFGGYAKTSPQLVDFLNRFYDKYGLALDPVYTGKMMYGLLQRMEAGHYPAGSKILALHSGGLQGIAGMNEKLGARGEAILNYPV